jgi:hypothetical protein
VPKPVYVIIINDRHADINAEVWSDEAKAKARARQLAKAYARSPADIDEQKIADWVLHLSYSCEGDAITVLRKELQ